MALTALIDLTTGQIDIQSTDPELLARFLGGRGLGAALLYQRVGPEVEPFAPENALIFTTGLLNGTTWPASSRYHVTFKSPATGAYGYANAGGQFASALRRTGFDALVITGKAPQPVIVQLLDREIRILPAGSLWGATTSAVEKQLTDQFGGKVAGIGPAGENLVRLAAIINDGGRAAARSGPGAIMGSKNLKAIHAVPSEQRLTTNPEFAQLVKHNVEALINHRNSQGLMQESTLYLMKIKNVVGDLPAKNHQYAQVPFIGSLTAKAFSAYQTKRKGCSVCPLRCARLSEIQDGDEHLSIEGPEYESADAFGPLVWNPNPEIVLRANALCNDLGLDTISTGVSIAFAMECHEKGLLSDDQYSLEWGDADTILGLIRGIAYREGLGDLLAEGVARASQKIGSGAERLAMHVKGVEMPRQEPRIAKTFGLGHATSNRGADHLYGLPTIDLAGNWDVARKLFPAEIVPTLMELADETYKADVLVYGEHFCAIVDSLGLCKFTTAETYCLMPDDLAQGLTLLGYPCTGDELLATGERIVNLERLYNQRHGFDRRQDILPRRFSEEPLEIYRFEQDAQTGQVTRSETPVTTGLVHDLDAMLDRYYQLRGWGSNGLPTRETLERLSITDLIPES